jgi:DNA-binding transcriptional LysR family regulator
VAARAGGGNARVLSYQVAEDIAAGTLVRVLQAFEPPPWPVHLISVSRSHVPSKVRAFPEHAAEQLSKLRVLHSEG